MIAGLVGWSAHNRWTVVFLSFFLAVAGSILAQRAPLDAIPDLSDTQVIVATEWMGRSPDLIEDQVTWPLSTALLGTTGVETVRGQSMFGMSFVYAIFVDGTPPQTARTRVSEAVARTRERLPGGVDPRIGPDASGVGWVFQYALVSDGDEQDAASLRTLQTTRLRPALQALEGVAEVATVGGFERTLEVSADPTRMLAHGIAFGELVAAVRSANALAGGGSIELAGHEQMIRTRSELRSIDDLLDATLLGNPPDTADAAGSAGMGGQAMGGATPMAASGGGDGMGSMSSAAPTTAPASSGAVPSQGPHLVRIRDVADVQWAPLPRRGVSDLDGRGETVGGIVVARQGQNALDVIERVKARLTEIPLPEGVRVVPVYDRAGLIHEAVATLGRTLGEEMIVVSLVILLFLRQWRTALVPVLTLPVAVLAAFIPMYAQGLTINIMSLGGIAVAVGAMVDASILIVENVHSHLANPSSSERSQTPAERMVHAMQEVAPSAFWALCVITVSFVPVFTLQEAEGRLFSPLAWTKTWSMGFAALLAVTLSPALVMIFVRPPKAAPASAHHDESHDPISRVLAAVYAPIVRLVVRRRIAVVVLAGLLVASTIPVLLSLPGEFMPPLREGTLLYMPTAPPGVSEAEAARILQAMDAELQKIPEVATVFGKMGRADSATDPAPLSMAETVIQLIPRDEWRPGLTWDGLIREMDERMRVPGFPNAWWMPVQTRTEMLATGIRSPLGIKVYGPNLQAIEDAAVRIESLLADVDGTRSIFADRATGGFYLDIDLRRPDAAGLGVSAANIASTLENTLAGARAGEWIHGRERAPITVRYARDFRTDPEGIERALVDRSGGAPVPLSTVADVRFASGPDMLRSENGQLVGYVFVDPGERPITSWVEDAKVRLDAVGSLGEGIRIEWAGSFQSLERANARLLWAVPLVLLVVALLIHANTRSWVETFMVMAAVPFSLIGAVWLLWALDYHTSVAVWVGMIALAGLDAETGVVMLLYLTLAWQKRGGAVFIRDMHTLEDVIVDGAARRIRPKLMTVACAMLGLLPVFWSEGAGADVMRRIAAPMVGGLVSSFALELLVYPAMFAIWKRRGMVVEG